MMALHHEFPFIKAIADDVASSTWGVDFVKVKAQAGLHGNEVADIIARRACTGTSSRPSFTISRSPTMLL